MQTVKMDRAGTPPDEGLSGGADRRTITSLINRELEDFGQRRVRRGRAVGRLIFLQVALLLIIAPLAVWPVVQPVAIGLEVVGLALFALAWMQNVSGNIFQAKIILLSTSLFVTAGSMVGQLFWHPDAIVPVGMASLPFLLSIIIAGLLFLPEVVLLISVGTAAFSTGIFFIALFVNVVRSPDDQIYWMAAIALGLQALTGIVAWQIAQFVLDYSMELATARREEYIATRYDALVRTQDDHAARLKQQAALIAANLVALTGRNYGVRVGAAEEELRPIADAFNVLAQQMGGFTESDQSQASLTDDLMLLAEVAGKMAEGGVSDMPIVSPLPMTANASGNLLRGVILTVQRAQTALGHRFVHLRDLAVDIGQRLTQSADQILAAENGISGNLATIGLLRSKTEHLVSAAQEMERLIQQAQDCLADLLPHDVTAHVHQEARHVEPTVELQQVIPGVTIQFETIDDQTEIPTGDAVAMPDAPRTAPRRWQ